METGTAHHDESALRQKAREAFDGGRLPRRRPDRMYGGPGSGVACAVCGVIITRDDMGLEIEFDRHGTPPGVDCYHVHPRCLAAWEVEVRRLDEGQRVNGMAALSPDDETPHVRRRAEKHG
jgi:hypothetical protein